ncbi:T9SS C-terminal target domain-containing protein [Rufibacter radiotolerans]|uniref:T9SS C-terminal target domain-containing protein n=1 Tax=Rufibacter radiotolerans TaxID=1379910 RepID=UPI0006646DCC|nr:T9SS C-terminal target domain-containing protein [Rufibacter radiotolerans]
MKIRLLFFFLFFLLGFGGYAQVGAYKALHQLSVVGAKGITANGNSKTGQGVPTTSAHQAKALTEVRSLYAELQRLQPMGTLPGASLSGGKLLPGVYRINGNLHLQQSLELLGGKQPYGAFVFQVEGDLTIDPAVAIELRQGVRAKNVFWLVKGKTALGAKSAFKGSVVSQNSIEAASGTTVEGKLFSQTGSVTVSNTTVTPLGSENIADLEIKHVVSSGPYRVGLEVTYTITLTNNGPDRDTNVVVNFEMPSGIQYLSSTTTEGTAFDPIRREWILDRFAKNGSATMVVKATIVKTEFSTTVATVTGDGTDPNIKNNTSELSICATPSKSNDISGPTTLCINTPGNVYQVPSVSGARKYSWTLPQGWAITSGSDTNTITVTTGEAEATGTITVRPVNACGDGPETTFTVTTVSSPPPMPSSITGPKEICASQENITYSINPVEGAVSYAWELPAGWAIVSGQGTPSVTVNTGATGGKVKVTATNGCSKSASSEVQVTIAPPAPQAPTQITGPGQVCANAPGLTYQVAAVTNATSYAWTVPAGWTIVSGQGTANLAVQAGTVGGQFTVKAQNNCGTSSTISYPVSIFSEVPTVGPIVGNALLCATTPDQTYSVEDVTNASTFTWRVPSDWQIVSGQGTRRITVKAGTSGKVQLIASNACGTGAASELNVSVSTQIPAKPSIISGIQAPCVDQENVRYSVVPVSGATGYTWTAPAGWTIVSGQGTEAILVKAGTAAGNLSVTATNGCGSSPAALLQVTPATTAPAAPAAISGETIPCINGQQTYTASNPLPGYTYNWTVPTGWSILSGQGTAIVVVKVGSNAGQVQVIAGNGCGQSAATSLAVTPTTGSPSLTASIQGETAVCASATQLTYSITAPATASSLTWTVPAGWVILSGQGTSEIKVRAGTAGGTVQVKAGNGCGQSTSRTLAVEVSSATPAMPGKITGPADVCANAGEATYSVAEVTGATNYTWTVPATWTIVRGQGTSTLVVRIGDRTANVEVTASNVCGTSAASALQVNMSESAPAKVGPIAGEKALCVSTAARTFSVPEAEGAKGYTWTVPSGWTILSGQGTRTLSVQTGTTGGMLKVTAFNYCNTTADSTNITLSQPLSATPTAIKGETAPCVTSTPLSYSVDAVTGATQYTWTVPAGWEITGGQGTQNIQVKAGSGAGAITVAAANACGASALVQLSVTPQVAAVTPAEILGETMPCGGGTQQTYSIKNPVAGVTYTWALPTGWEFVSGQGTGTVIVKAGNAAGNVSVQATNSCGTSPAKVLTVAPASLVPATDPIQGVNALCASAVQTYSVVATTGATNYQWQVPAGWTILSGQGTHELQVKTGTGSGEISVSTQYSCGAGDKRILAVNVAPENLAAPGAISGTIGVCEKQNQITYSILPVTGALTYEWKVPAGWFITSGQGGTSITVAAGANAGQVSVVARNVCSTSTASTQQVSVSPNVPPVLGAITGQTAACTTTRVTYQVAEVAGVTTYTWTLPQGWVLETGQGTNVITALAGTTNGTISVVGKNGCDLTSAASKLDVGVLTNALGKPSPIQVNSSSLTPCSGEKGLVFSIAEVNGATSYEWSYPADWKLERGQGTTTLTLTAGNTAGQVSVVAKNACGQSQAQTVAMVPSTGVPVLSGEITGTPFVCANAGTVTYSLSGASATDQYLWTVPAGWTLVNGQNSSTITVIPSTSGGQITVKAQNSCGISSAKTLAVSASTGEVARPGVITGPTALCASNNELVYSVAAVTGASSYEWSLPAGWKLIRGQGTTSITVTAPEGTGTVSVKTLNGCSTSEASYLMVTVSPPLTTSLFITDESSACLGNQFSVPANPGVTFTWSILTNETGWAIASGQGTNKVTVTGPANASLTSAKISVTANNATCSVSSATQDINPKYLAPELNLPNVFSPNNDGKNDLWVVRNLLEFPENELVILNRWGSEVYRMKKYRNNWDGGGLAEGTYFYVLKVRLCDNQEVVHKGYVTLMR